LKDTKKIDPRYVISAVRSVLEVCPSGAVIAIESTISPGTIDREIRPAIEKRGLKTGSDIHLVHVPERILPGNMIYELEHNSRTIGADSKEIAEKIKKLYESFCKGNIVLTDIKTAEMTKVVENTYRDINIAFANELAKICRADGMDVYEIIRIANMHPRVNVLMPGPGVGGHCISVDPWFLVGDYPDIVDIIFAARAVNDSMPEYVLKRTMDIMADSGIKDFSKVGLYGLTYKENVDDTRESPALQLLNVMKKRGISGIKSYDPMLNKAITDGQVMDFNEFLSGIDMVVVLVAHSHLKENTEKILQKTVYDTKNVLSGKKVYKL
jgi:UDP-N-acetyl-D-mannosaminuronic acid dehydrogenase